VLPRIQSTTSEHQLRERLISSMEAFFSEFRHRAIYYYPNPGNAGDSLIATATYQAFNRAGIPYYIASKETNIDNQILFLGGGGNLIPLYNELRNYIIENQVLDRVKHLVILPHSIRGNEDILANMGHKVTIFCREYGSYSHVIQHVKTPYVYLAHDMATHFDIDLFDAETAKYTDVPELFEKKVRQADPSSPLFNLENYVRNDFYRTDGEASSRPNSVRSLDIAKLFEFGVWPENAAKATKCLLTAVRKSAAVRTDRLHVAMTCALAQRECTLFDNNYGKNSSIFEHTIRKFSQYVKLEQAS